jgi:hypothetical protein
LSKIGPEFRLATGHSSPLSGSHDQPRGTTNRSTYRDVHSETTATGWFVVGVEPLTRIARLAKVTATELFIRVRLTAMRFSDVARDAKW